MSQKWKVICPRNPEHKEFSVTAHVAEDWKVDERGNFISVIATIDTIHSPSKGDMFWCIACKDEAQTVDTDD